LFIIKKLRCFLFAINHPLASYPYDKNAGYR
jgi:hypothetical protein